MISDAIPEGTELESTPTAPTGWTVVYSTTANPESTVAVEGTAGTAAAWTTDQPTLSNVTRVGFIFDNGTSGDASDDTIDAGTNITGFEIDVITSGLTGTTGGDIENIAQVFGQTESDPDDEIVYDESGDQNPNNFNDNQTPPDETGTAFDPNEDTGVPDPNEDGVDDNNDNQGTGPKGEVNVVTVGTPTSDDDILNGPDGTPEAVGPTNVNDDFTNIATTTTENNPDETVDVTNTVGVPSTNNAPIDNVIIEPLSPTEANTASDPTATFGNNSDIPDGTIVTITDPNDPTNTATYTYDQTNGEFDLTSGSPVNIGSINAGAEKNYTVNVDLPDGAGENTGFGIPLVAFSDDGDRQTDNETDAPVSNGGTGPAFTSEPVNNITINRIYAGFINMVKESRILNADGTEAVGFSTAAKDAQPGQFIEYRVTYENVSEPAQGSGNVILEAQNFVIGEDGTATPNNWATDQDTDGTLDTSHTQNTSATKGSVFYYNGTIDNDGDGIFEPSGADTTNQIGNVDPSDETTVTGYANEVGNVSPGEEGELIFRRFVE